MSKKRLNVITLGIMLSMFLASMEGTVVATAMPTIVGQLGGLAVYSWVFSLYLLTSTTTVPIYGKLSDLFGRKLVYAVSMGLFLGGSVLCGQARTMEQLILFRGIQGIGAGGVLPLAFTIIGELFSLEQRARMQGLFSAVWGISAVIGPLIGGFLVDQISWQWVFYINVIPGLLAAALVWFAWQSYGSDARRARRLSIDYPGAILISLSALSLLLGLQELGSPIGLALLAAGVLMVIVLIWVERRAVDPILPLHLFTDRVFNVAILHGILAGWAVFGSLNYVPLFVQAVLGTTATQAGISLTPMSLAWTTASIFGGRLLLTVGYRTLSLIGMALVTIGAFMMMLINTSTSQLMIMIYTGMMGVGMGLSIPAFLIAVQSVVPRKDLGVATSTVQFSRSMGGTLGVSILGALLGSGLSRNLVESGINPASVSLDSLIDSVASVSSAIEGPLRAALAVSIANMFIFAFVPALAGLLAVFLAPPGKISQLVEERAKQRGPEADADYPPG